MIEPLLLLASVALGLLLAGAVTGIAGFGFAIVGTTALATAIDPAAAVVFMIVPILAVNFSLVRDLSRTDLSACGRRFWPLLVAALLGAVVGMAVLDRLPGARLRVALGLVSLAFVASTQSAIPIPGWTAVADRCFVETTPAMLGVGGVSGLLFGGTNVGVQLIAYLRSCGLPHGLFVGVVAMAFLGLNAVRVALAGILGMYPDPAFGIASAVAAIPAVAGVAVGTRLRDRVAARHRRIVVMGLIAVIGVRLVLGGLGVA